MTDRKPKPVLDPFTLRAVARDAAAYARAHFKAAKAYAETLRGPTKRRRGVENAENAEWIRGFVHSDTAKRLRKIAARLERKRRHQ
jgi:hypothetical protein